MDDIRAVERLMQTLDENPHLMEAVRSRMLTRELLELPQTVVRLTDRVDQIAEQLAQLTDRVDRLTERVDQIAEQLAQLTDRVDRLTERVDQIAEQLAQLTERVDQLTERMDRRFDQVANDLTRIKERAAVDTTKEQSHVIASVLGLRRQFYLHGNEVIDLARHQDTTDISTGDLTSFQRADLIMEATDASGELHYIAVEVSFTADERDTRRAIRNAAYLTRFTGRPAHAVVAAYRHDREIQPTIDSGQILWYPLDEDDDPD
jgi:uncharacterized protein YoxC